MTERRYFNIIGTGDIKDELTGKIIRGSKIGDLLNELYYENHRIKRRNNRYVKQNRELIEENEQLKKENKEYIRGLELRKVECQSWASDVRELREQNCQLEKENEQLKQSNQKLNDELQETMGYLALKSGVEKENEQLKSENNMLKHTIGRNEAYIKKLTETSEWHC